MSPKEVKVQGTVVEPLFGGNVSDLTTAPQEVVEEAMKTFFAREVPIGVEAPIAALTPDGKSVAPTEAITPTLVALAPPTTHHHPELPREMAFANWKAKSLLRSCFCYTFNTVYVSIPQLVVTGSVWNETEEATYRVRLHNNTYFDLSDMRVTLWVRNNGGEAVILNPPGSIVDLGDVGYGSWSGFAEFKVKAIKAGNVDLQLRIDGFIGAMKPRCSYSGSFWNYTTNTWDTNPAYKQTHTVYPS